MIADHLQGLEKFESGLWKIADTLRANSNLASNEYFMPIMGLIFLRHATNRFYEAKAAIDTDRAAGKMPDRPLVDADFTRRRALNLPEAARFDVILKTPKDGNLGAALTAAMDAIEDAFPPLSGQLPKDYGRFDASVLEEMMRVFDTEGLRAASGDVFGRIYEYFLAEFSKQGAHDGGEFFTPPSIVQTIVNVIEPDHGTILDPACGSGGMFVQSSHFIEDEGQDTMKRVTFFGHEKNETTAKLAQINLAVHGLQGTIRAGNEAITYYKDPHELVGKCDFVMANPPFNVDEVDAEKVKGDKRLPFGLPGVNKTKKVSNANYLWLSYFYSYLNETGRAGVVMSSQASSAGRDEATVRQKLVETGAVDVMIDIRGNFFYTRTVPCQLWFFDRAKENDDARRDHVLMLDARQIFRKVSRSVCDFSPEQQKNIAAIVWLYRGQQDRYLKLVESYLAQAVELGAKAREPLRAYEEVLAKLIDLMGRFVRLKRKDDPLAEPWDELVGAQAMLKEDVEAFGKEAMAQATAWIGAARDNAGLNITRIALHPLAENCRDLTKQIDLATTLAGRVIDIAVKEMAARDANTWNNVEVNRARKALEEARSAAVEALRQARYFVKQADWLQERFPDAVLQDVEGLVRRVDRATIEAHDWSLTPGRYVGVSRQEADEDFDFEEALRSIHIDLKGLNDEAVELAAHITKNFEALGI
ncbi:type I restriction-modification system subunit M [Rhizobium leguminosarum]|uniref:type I restriction-modification system subunit M n=1 Tax=Rhizobium leguminosarum TaxID=384 RepID=UPI00103A07F8|nr:class I SAM-dependent DNA methyltransferase [Rhizobium leguminosarum]MBB4326553.1 type I restriction enzyme M protein [Rhizobium leguminosarum]MBB4352157.1 type I restriction enzyme M protein [Rhizobium leguminosarum]MBB4546805.1 type I restriction enzyme M protein [Rhizobium leguminosarum]MBB4559138.1 type I restriction enzyme M protein [Rhizobium leguminosarum]TBZ57821.1 SAM-dependent DNA methyltransferase [Rhizobium leguminosarum bv. viciae]